MRTRGQLIVCLVAAALLPAGPLAAAPVPVYTILRAYDNTSGIVGAVPGPGGTFYGVTCNGGSHLKMDCWTR